jgi:hypothetical protein
VNHAYLLTRAFKIKVWELSVIYSHAYARNPAVGKKLDDYKPGTSNSQKGAQAQAQTILCLAESGFYPLPSVVRTYAPVGRTPLLREWCTRDHLSAISAISPEGKLYFQSQDRALASADVVAFLEHLLREVPGRMGIIWDGAPIHRSQVTKEFLANGAAPRLHLERLPA